MTKPATILDYSRRIGRVVAYIGEHLDEPLDLERLAGVACFSPCHFHRIYRALTGETTMDTLRRQRLHRAAGEIVRDAAEIVLIARRAGYGSVEAFTRAFRQVYGIPPATYRRRGHLVPPPAYPNISEDSMQDVTIRHLPPVRVAALRHVGPYMAIGAAFEQLYVWAAGRRLLGPATRAFAVFYDDCDAIAPDALRSDACLLVGPEVTGDGTIRIMEIPGGRHAVLLHKGPYAELESVYRRLYRDWLPQSGETPADQPCFEEYLNNPRTLPPEEWLTEICLPLV